MKQPTENLDEITDSMFKVKRDLESARDELGFAAKANLGRIGAVAEEDAPDFLEQMLTQFSGGFPKTIVFSDFYLVPVWYSFCAYWALVLHPSIPRMSPTVMGAAMSCGIGITLEAFENVIGRIAYRLCAARGIN